MSNTMKNSACDQLEASRWLRWVNPLAVLAGTLLCVSAALAADFTPQAVSKNLQLNEDVSRDSAPPFVSALANAISVPSVMGGISVGIGYR